jgi:hypothetical protein
MLLMAMAAVPVPIEPLAPAVRVRSRSTRPTTTAIGRALLRTPRGPPGGDDDDDDDDDGWGDGSAAETAGPAAGTTAPPSDWTSKSRELAGLRDDRAASKPRSGPAGESSRGGANGGGGVGVGGERDLFIPAVTLVSVVGFAGLYGYEMLRLHSRGELYLPWES